MKQLTYALLLLFYAAHSYSQKQIPEFGKVDKAELEITSCDFDKNAEALVLFEDGELYGDWNQVENVRHVRIKILKDKGLKWANVHIKYYSLLGAEYINGIVAQTYNLDAAGNIVVTKLDKKLIYDKKLNKRYSEIAFSLPGVKAGSIIEYKYTHRGAGNRRWYFQRSIPVQISRYCVNLPTEFEMSSIPHCMLPYETKIEQRSGRDVQVYTMKKIPALRDEPYISCDEDYLQSIEARLIAYNPRYSPRINMIKSWPEMIKLLMEDEDFGVQLKKNVPRTKDLDSVLSTIKSPFEKMTTIHKYVRKNMQWNNYDNFWASEGIKSAWKDKKGTSGEINLILVNLLRDAGLKAHPVLVSTKENGKVNTFIAGFDQFNKVMAYVEIDEKTYVLDAVEKFTPSSLIPLDVTALEGFVIEKVDTYEWGWKTLWDDNALFSNAVFIVADIDKNGQMKGNVSIASDGYARVKKMPTLQEGKKEFIEKYFSSQNNGIKIDSLKLQNEKNDTLPLIQDISFSQDLNSSGDYRYFTANIFSGLEKNPFTDDGRFSDIFFGYKQRISIVGNINIPYDYQFDELPKNLRMIMPDTSISFTRLAAVTENRLSFRITLDFKRPVYFVDEYPEFKEFYKKLFDLLNEQFVIHKKS